MTDAELRTLVRQVIAREHGAVGRGATHPDAVTTRRSAPALPDMAGCTSHASHARFTIARVDDRDDCIVEPDVRCNHCGFCQTFGH